LEVLYRIVRTWKNEGTAYAPPGLLGGEDRDSYLSPVSISVTDATFEETLQALVAQAPGLGWSIQERKGLAGGRVQCSVGLFTGRSWMQTDWTLPVGASD
jgi:hypothetical protein